MPRRMKQEGVPAHRGQAGFTLVELLIVLVVFSIVAAIGLGGFRRFNRSTNVDQAARALGSDVTLARSFAIRRGENVALVADEAARSYKIRDAAGNVLAAGGFGFSSDLPLTLLNIKTSGDSLTFNSRGMLVSGSVVEIDLGRDGLTKQLDVSPLGRTRVQ